MGAAVLRHPAMHDRLRHGSSCSRFKPTAEPAGLGGGRRVTAMHCNRARPAREEKHTSPEGRCWMHTAWSLWPRAQGCRLQADHTTASGEAGAARHPAGGGSPILRCARLTHRPHACRRSTVRLLWGNNAGGGSVGARPAGLPLKRLHPLQPQQSPAQAGVSGCAAPPLLAPTSSPTDAQRRAAVGQRGMSRTGWAHQSLSGSWPEAQPGLGSAPCPPRGSTRRLAGRHAAVRAGRQGGRATLRRRPQRGSGSSH